MCRELVANDDVLRAEAPRLRDRRTRLAAGDLASSPWSGRVPWTRSFRPAACGTATCRTVPREHRHLDHSFRDGLPNYQASAPAPAKRALDESSARQEAALGSALGGFAEPPPAAAPDAVSLKKSKSVLKQNQAEATDLPRWLWTRFLGEPGPVDFGVIAEVRNVLVRDARTDDDELGNVTLKRPIRVVRARADQEHID